MSCCLCSAPDSPHAEQRRSGDNGDLEEWHFCAGCWQEMKAQRADTDREICARYIVFIQFVIGGYRMQRAFNGNQASQIMPGK
jgi:hypothetical protein